MKKTYIALFGLMMLMGMSSLSYASSGAAPCVGTACQIRSEIKTLKTLIVNKVESIKANREDFHNDFENAKRFIKPLTGAQKTGAMSIIKEKSMAMATLQKSIKTNTGTINWSGYITQGTAIFTAFQEKLLPYIASEQVENFKKFISARIALLSKNAQLRAANTKTKTEIKNKKDELKSLTGKQLGSGKLMEAQKKQAELKKEMEKKQAELKKETEKKQKELQKESDKKQKELHNEFIKKQKELEKQTTIDDD